MLEKYEVKNGELKRYLSKNLAFVLIIFLKCARINKNTCFMY